MRILQQLYALSFILIQRLNTVIAFHLTDVLLCLTHEICHILLTLQFLKHQQQQQQQRKSISIQYCDAQFC